MASPITELASGVIDGANTQFATSRDYKPGSLVVFNNGFADATPTEGGAKDFTVAPPPQLGDVVTVYYRPI